MKRLLFFLPTILLAPLLAFSAESVVLGSGVSNEYASTIDCPPDALCMDSMYLWVFDARKTLAGPPVNGRVRALIAQHTDARSKYVRSVRLFVVKPIESDEVRRAHNATHYLLAVSPRYEDGTYCLPMNPQSVGLEIDASRIARKSDSGYFCFAASLAR